MAYFSESIRGNWKMLKFRTESSIDTLISVFNLAIFQTMCQKNIFRCIYNIIGSKVYPGESSFLLYSKNVAGINAYDLRLIFDFCSCRYSTYKLLSNSMREQFQHFPFVLSYL